LKLVKITNLALAHWFFLAISNIGYRKTEALFSLGGNPFLLLTAPLIPVLIGSFFDIIFVLYVG